MRVAICGGRNESLTRDRLRELKDELCNLNDGRLTILLGGCPTGIDEEVRRASTPLGYPYRLFPADWKQYGPAAGPVRNSQMIAEADHVIAFPGGRGTADTVRKARRVSIPVTFLD